MSNGAAILAAAERSGARLVTVGNLYPYGQVDAPISETTSEAPNGIKGLVRQQMWRDALALHQAGRILAAEVRGSDYLGPQSASASIVTSSVIAPLLNGKRPRMPFGRADVAHSWTVDGDVAALVCELALVDDDAADTAYGRVWHVPTDAPATVNEVAALVSEIADAPARTVSALPRSVVTLGGFVVPLLRAVKETRHQFERPWVIDSSAAQERFGLRPTSLRHAVAETIGALGARRPARAQA